MLSVCIPLKNRARNVEKCIKALDKLIGVDEIVIGDFYSDDTDFSFLQDIKTPVNIVKIDGEFSVGKGKNVAAKNARGDILFFLDADLITPQHLIDKILKLVPQGLVYSPIMWLDSGDGIHGEWAVASFGQVALKRELWESHKWEEWSSYGGEDNLFIEPYIYTCIRDTAMDFIHQHHSMEDRTKYHTKPAGSDLEEYNLKTYGVKSFD